MSLSRRAKRGIAAFQKIQWSGKRARYHLKPATMIDIEPGFKDSVKKVMNQHTETLAKLAAAEAMEILIKNGEKTNELQTAPHEEVGTVAPEPEGITESFIPYESQDGEGC
jgi:hypothetical protein